MDTQKQLNAPLHFQNRSEAHAVSLSELEWRSVELPLENETKETHLSLAKWLYDRARMLGIRKQGDSLSGGGEGEEAGEDEGESGSDSDESEEEDATPKSPSRKAEADPVNVTGGEF